MALAAIDPTEGPVTIPVRGHPVRDWVWRLRHRGEDTSCADPPENRRIVSETGLQLEVLLPGFRARDIGLRAAGHRIELEARREETRTRGGRELRVAQLSLSVGDRYDPAGASADLSRGCLVIAVPSSVVRIPVRPR